MCVCKGIPLRSFRDYPINIFPINRWTHRRVGSRSTPNLDSLQSIRTPHFVGLFCSHFQEKISQARRHVMRRIRVPWMIWSRRIQRWVKRRNPTTWHSSNEFWTCEIATKSRINFCHLDFKCDEIRPKWPNFDVRPAVGSAVPGTFQHTSNQRLIFENYVSSTFCGGV